MGRKPSDLVAAGLVLTHSTVVGGDYFLIDDVSGPNPITKTISLDELQQAIGPAILSTAPSSLFSIISDSGNSATDNTLLSARQLLPGQLASNGNTVIASYVGTFANNSHTKKVQAYFGPLGNSGDTLIFDSTALGATGSGQWWLDVQIIRISTVTVKCIARLTTQTTGVSTDVEVSYTAIVGLTFTNGQYLSFYGQAGAGGADNDIVLHMAKALFAP